MTTTDRRIARWRRLYASTEPWFVFQIKFPDEKLPIPEAPRQWPSKVRERIEYGLELYDVRRRRAELVEDDAIPYLNNITGTEIFAEAFGCPVQRDEDKMPFALPAVHSAEEADELETPTVATSSLAYLFDIAGELHRRADDGALMRLVDIQSPMDITSLIWEKVSLFAALIEQPDAVQRLSAKVCDLLIAFMDEWFSRYGTSFIAHYPEYYMEGGITLSEDEIGTVSPGMFDTFFRDELVRLAEHFDGLGIHCCANSKHQWKKFAELPRLAVLNLNANNSTDQGFTIEESLAFFGNQFVQYPLGMNIGGDPVEWIKTNGEGRRLVFEVSAEGREHARRLAGELNEFRSKQYGA